jgi:CubicO group peptidase (beta-lactamase class C family)
MPADAIFRIRSETKAVTGVAMLILYDEGKWKLDDPVTKYVPELANLRVAKRRRRGPAGPDADQPPADHARADDPHGRLRLWHGRRPRQPADQAYYRAGVLQSDSLNELVTKVATLPMYAEPGTMWRYSVAADIQGYDRREAVGPAAAGVHGGADLHAAGHEGHRLLCAAGEGGAPGRAL